MSIVIVPDTEHKNDDFALDDEVMRAGWEMEDRHFWHAARNDWILRAMREAGARRGATVLDVGSGSGAVARALLDSGYEVVGVDTAAPLVKKAHERRPSGTFVVGNVAKLPNELRGPYDVVTALDVIEHVADPVGLLRDAVAFLRPGGLAVVTVPALPSLWTVVDDVSGHKKRYETGELATEMRRAGLVDVEERGIFRWSIPLVALSRRRWTRTVADLSPEERKRILLETGRVPGRIVNGALRALCRAELVLGWRASIHRNGASLLAVGRAPRRP